MAFWENDHGKYGDYIGHYSSGKDIRLYGMAESLLGFSGGWGCPGRRNTALSRYDSRWPSGHWTPLRRPQLAIVGRNGSGKTTFIKLMCRLYDPTEGTILLNGVDIRKYDYDEYMSIFSIVFQDFRLFGFRLAEGYITEFHEIFIVVPFLHSEGALVHGVGDVQVGEIPL